MSIAHKKIEINIKGRDFVIGDLHGCFDLFNQMLNEIDFDKSVDRMFSVGDLIDRGDKSIECLRLIKEDWFYTVRGNHEQLLIQWFFDGDSPGLWNTNGGLWHVVTDNSELKGLAILVNKLPYSMTIDTKLGDIGICHAQPPSLNWFDAVEPDDRSKDIMLWARSWIADRQMPSVEGVYMTYHGHTPVEEPLQIGNVNFIDTGAVYQGVLTCVRI